MKVKTFRTSVEILIITYVSNKYNILYICWRNARWEQVHAAPLCNLQKCYCIMLRYVHTACCSVSEIALGETSVFHQGKIRGEIWAI